MSTSEINLKSSIGVINILLGVLAEEMERTQNKKLYYLSMQKDNFTQPIRIFSTLEIAAQELSTSIGCSANSILTCIQKTKPHENFLPVEINNTVVKYRIITAHHQQTTEFIITSGKTTTNYFVRSYNKTSELIARIISDIK